MRILHCADLHLDAKMTTYLSKEKAKERKMEILRTFTRMVDYAKKNNVSVILIAGDMFDTRNISAITRNTVRDVIVQNPQIDFLYLRGNHDHDNFLSKLGEVPSNLLLFDDKWKTYTYGTVTISGLELNQKNMAEAYPSLILEHGTFNIVMLHGQIADYRNKKKNDTISLGDLKNKNIDYLALGHVHSYRLGRLDSRGLYCYSGCMEGRGFDECGKKGFVILDIDEENHTMTTEFVSIAHRNLYTLFVDVTGVATTREAAAKLEAAIKESGYPSKSLVKFVLKGEVDVECELDIDFLEEQFAEYFYHEKVVDETNLYINYGEFEKDISLKGEFVRLVYASDYSEEEKAKIIRYGILALQGEEI